MDDSLNRYLEARKQAVEKRERLQELVRVAEEILVKLRDHWRDLSIIDSDQRATTGEFIRKTDWPNADEIAKALTEWRDARNQASSVYQSLGEEQRGTVLPPD